MTTNLTPEDPDPLSGMRRHAAAAVLTMVALSFAMPLAAAPVAQPAGPVAAGTETDLLLLVLYVLLALVFSFLCSIAEAVLLSVTPSYIEGLKDSRPSSYELLTRVKRDNIDRSLAAILTLNTIAHTVGAIGAGAKATVVFGSAWFGLFSAVMTLAILFFSEIIPKTLGAMHWARLAVPAALFVRGLVISLYPVVWTSERLTRLLAREGGGHAVTREEFLAMARVGEKEGQIHGSEIRIIRNLLRFDKLRLEDLMTPRTVLKALPEGQTVDEAMTQVTAHPFSRLPVYEQDLDHVTGFVLRDDVLLAQASGEGGRSLASLKRSIASVPETKTPSALLEQLLEERQHIALIVDEHGGTSGIVTLEDLVETLTGMEIMDETDSVTNLREAARKRWEKRLQPK